MRKKFTITLDEQVYEALHRVIGGGSISQFIEDLVRPHVIASLVTWKQHTEKWYYLEGYCRGRFIW